MHRQPPKPQASGFLKQIRPGRNHQHRNLRPFPHSLDPIRLLGRSPGDGQATGKRSSGIAKTNLALNRYAVEEPEFYSMTSSARTRIVSGIVRPSSLAVLRLTTSSYF